ncbi:MAG TPA: NAD(P)-binding domain-containing protein, partial [Janthinobacterium sp.]|nr:NAD(P)-binding domain-containing protein [Janthinobacterium sp.]
MKIGIIGTGNIGSTLVHLFADAGHQVKMANSRGPDSLAALAAETGTSAVQVREAVRDVDLVVVTIPLRNITQLPADLFAGVAKDVAVVDTCNYYPRERDGKIAAIEEGMPESRWTEQLLKHPLIKAFNNIYAGHLKSMGKPAGSPGRIALPVAGDDAKAKALVMQLIDAMGYDPVDAGPLDESWRQQPGTPVYAADFDAAGVRRALELASRERK